MKKQTNKNIIECHIPDPLAKSSQKRPRPNYAKELMIIKQYGGIESQGCLSPGG
jgi:hypothetical protein